MAEIKVIAVQASGEILAALEKLLGVKVDVAGLQALQTAVEVADVPEAPVEPPKPVIPFGTLLTEDEDEGRFKYVWAVPGATDLDVKVVANGVQVTAAAVNEEIGGGFTKLLQPQGAFDEVTAVYDTDTDAGVETLTVRLFKVDEDGRDVEIIGWEGSDEVDDETDYGCDCPECEGEETEEELY